MNLSATDDPVVDAQWMRRAIELARNGEGLVEPNPMVGCVVVKDGRVLAEGFHRHFGGPHAERDALAQAGEGADLAGATWYVTLEPCCHTGKTPPCSGAVIASRPQRVVVAMRDPFPLVNGGGLREITAAGIEVTVGVESDLATELCAPFLKRLQTGRPWVIVKYAMTLDGKMATAKGDSRWISSGESRRRVHQLRGRMDAIVVGAGTAAADDPRLTVRPAGPRTPVRIVVDRQASLALDSQLVRTAGDVPVRLFVGPNANPQHCEELTKHKVEVIRCEHDDNTAIVATMLDHCGANNMTNIMVEGGGTLLGVMHDARLIDEIHAYIAPKIVGGREAISPIGGVGLSTMREAQHWETKSIDRIGDDVCVVLRNYPTTENRSGESQAT